MASSTPKVIQKTASKTPSLQSNWLKNQRDGMSWLSESTNICRRITSNVKNSKIKPSKLKSNSSKKWISSSNKKTRRRPKMLPKISQKKPLIRTTLATWTPMARSTRSPTRKMPLKVTRSSAKRSCKRCSTAWRTSASLARKRSISLLARTRVNWRRSDMLSKQLIFSKPNPSSNQRKCAWRSIRMAWSLICAAKASIKSMC